jgi:hypothetical protein
MSDVPAEVDHIVSEALSAAAEANWDRLKLLLHPYLRWSVEDDAVTLRGRTNVLRWLAARHAPLAHPERVELRDGQIYRWFGKPG